MPEKSAGLSRNVGERRKWGQTQLCGRHIFKDRLHDEALKVKVLQGFRKGTQKKRVKGKTETMKSRWESIHRECSL